MSSKSEKLDLRYEHIRCALCGGDDTRVKYKIRNQNSQFSGIWVNGLWHQNNRTEIIVICKVCGLVYVNPRLALIHGVATYSTEQELTYFERSYESRLLAYTDLIHQLPIWLGRDAKTLLDVGCGDGVLLEVAQKAGIESSGTEVSDMLIHVVRERLGEESIVSGNLGDLPAAHYDVITLINVLEHLRNPAEMLRIVARLLRTDGILLVHVPNLGGLPANLYGACWHQLEPLEHFYYFTVRTLTMLMQKAGLESIDRFNLITSRGSKGRAQRLLGKMGIYVDNGLGIVARRLPEVE